MNALAMNGPFLTAWWLTQDTPIVAVYCLMGESPGKGGYCRERSKSIILEE
jgi:hypothetical protein